MDRYSLREAQDHLEQLIAEARKGKTVLIDHNDGAVQLVPVPLVLRRRKAGSARGKVRLTDDFDAPLTDFNEYME